MAKFEDRKLVEMVLYILNRTGGTDFYHVFKILYFAEIKHLAKWGRNITPDTFCALDYGPVPSDLYNAVKEQESPHSELARLLKESTTFAGADAPYVMLANRDADTKYLSKSEREMLNSFVDCSELMVVQKVKVGTWRFLGHLIEDDVELITATIKSSPFESEARLAQYGIL